MMKSNAVEHPRQGGPFLSLNSKQTPTSIRTNKLRDEVGRDVSKFARRSICHRQSSNLKTKILACLIAALLSCHLAGAQTNAPIPWDHIGARAGANYQGDGLTVVPTAFGAWLRCAFQRLEGEATSQGLWLTSTVTNQAKDRFRLVAAAVGRDVTSPPLGAMQTLHPAMVSTGIVSAEGQTLRFTRPGLVEEYTVSMDGVRQDFVVFERPKGSGELMVSLSVSGAKVEEAPFGLKLILEKSGRKIAYSRLLVTDATGRKLKGRMLMACSAGSSDPAASEWSDPGSGANEATRPTLAVLVDDSDAVYPVRIDPTFSDANWISMGGIPGTDSQVRAAVVDGSGNLFIAGDFTIVGDTLANHIAKWNGSSWSPLGSGLNDWVLALAVSGSNLYAGGYFTTAGGSAASHIAKWDGSGWSELGSGMDNLVYTLAASGSDLYAGGQFSAAGGSAANYIARWNGSSWSAVGSGMGGDPPFVYALAVSGSDLYAGGAFTIAGGKAANRIAKWNGSTWSPLASGMSGGSFPYVYALAVSDTNVYAGGGFTTAGSSVVNYIARWNGISWSALGPEIDNLVLTLSVSGSNVYAGGAFTTVGGTACIAKWDGSSWSALGSGMNGPVSALAVAGSDLFAGGGFTAAGGSAADRIAKWNGARWSPLGLGMNNTVNALAVSGSNVYAGGYFTATGGSGTNCIAKWNGSSWSALGSGLFGGGLPTVNALAVSGNDLYAGGQFSEAGSAARDIAKWNGNSWSALGSGVDSNVYALAVAGSDLYVGGQFTTAGGGAANYVAKWNGSSWSALGLGLEEGDGYSPSAVYALTVAGSNVYAGGNFRMAGASLPNYIAKWDGTNWSRLGSGFDLSDAHSPSVYALAVSGSYVYAGGAFIGAGGNWVYHIAKWDGSFWNPLGSGMNGFVAALAVSGSDLYAGGQFTMAGGKVSAYAARAVLGDPPGYNRISNSLLAGGAVQLSYIGDPAINYALDRTFNLVPPAAWVPQQTNTMSISGVLLFTNTPDPTTNNFWRIRSVP